MRYLQFLQLGTFGEWAVIFSVARKTACREKHFRFWAHTPRTSNMWSDPSIFRTSFGNNLHLIWYARFEETPLWDVVEYLNGTVGLNPCLPQWGMGGRILIEVPPIHISYLPILTSINNSFVCFPHIPTMYEPTLTLPSSALFFTSLCCSTSITLTASISLVLFCFCCFLIFFCCSVLSWCSWCFAILFLL